MSSRYSSQIAVAEIGAKGQEQIKNANVLIIGAGGLGTPVATYLAASGIGNITLIDGDKIAKSNLHRQWMYAENEVGKYKCEVLLNKLSETNPEIKINCISEYLNADNIKDLVSKADVVCDCTDNVKARLLIDETSYSLKTPLVYAAVREWIGYLTILNYRKGSRITDIFSSQALIEQEENNCSITGIVGTTCGILGSMQACEVLKIILGRECILDGAILCYDTLTNVQRILKLRHH